MSEEFSGPSGIMAFLPAFVILRYVHAEYKKLFTPKLRVGMAQVCAAAPYALHFATQEHDAAFELVVDMVVVESLPVGNFDVF